MIGYFRLGAVGMCLFVFVLLPSDPSGGYSCGATDWIDIEEAKRIHETFGIYSLIRSRDSGSSDREVWALAKTILEESVKHQLDPLMVVAVIEVESGFRRRAVSSAGARGLMQIRPFVAEALAKQMPLDQWEGGRSLDDPITNVKLGVFYLGELKRRFNHLITALSAYQWGPSLVRQRLETGGAVPTGYAARVLSLYSAYRKRRPERPLALETNQGDAPRVI